jgi:hypothetical protein
VNQKIKFSLRDNSFDQNYLFIKFALPIKVKKQKLFDLTGEAYRRENISVKVIESASFKGNFHLRIKE